MSAKEEKVEALVLLHRRVATFTMGLALLGVSLWDSDPNMALIFAAMMFLGLPLAVVTARVVTARPERRRSSPSRSPSPRRRRRTRSPRPEPWRDLREVYFVDDDGVRAKAQKLDAARRVPTPSQAPPRSPDSGTSATPTTYRAGPNMLMTDGTFDIEQCVIPTRPDPGRKEER